MSDFKKEFLKHYLAVGIAAMPKRDIDALVMHLLDEYGGENDAPLKILSNQQTSVQLRAAVTRVKALRYDAMLKYKSGNVVLAQWKFLEVLAKSQFDAEKKKVGFVIEDSFTRHWVQDALKKHGLFFDNSFNTEIVRVDFEQFCKVLAFMYDKRSVAALKKVMQVAIDANTEINFAEIKKKFLEGAAVGMGKAAGSSAIVELLSLVGS